MFHVSNDFFFRDPNRFGEIQSGHREFFEFGHNALSDRHSVLAYSPPATLPLQSSQTVRMSPPEKTG